MSKRLRLTFFSHFKTDGPQFFAGAFGKIIYRKVLVIGIIRKDLKAHKSSTYHEHSVITEMYFLSIHQRSYASHHHC